MLNADEDASGLDGSKLHIGIVQARFNEGITAAGQGLPRRTAGPGRCQTIIQHVLVPKPWRCPWRCRPWPKAMNSAP